MGWLTPAIKRGVERGVREALDEFSAPGGRLTQIVEDRVWSVMDETMTPNAQLTEIGWLWALKLCFHKHGCDRAEAHALAVSTAAQYLADEKIRFGDPGYAWTRTAAGVIAEEYEFRHWETPA